MLSVRSPQILRRSTRKQDIYIY